MQHDSWQFTAGTQVRDRGMWTEPYFRFLLLRTTRRTALPRHFLFPTAQRMLHMEIRYVKRLTETRTGC